MQSAPKAQYGIREITMTGVLWLFVLIGIFFFFIESLQLVLVPILLFATGMTAVRAPKRLAGQYIAATMLVVLSVVTTLFIILKLLKVDISLFV